MLQENVTPRGRDINPYCKWQRERFYMDCATVIIATLRPDFL